MSRIYFNRGGIYKISIRGGTPFIYGIPIGSLIVPNDGFLFVWNINIRLGTTPSQIRGNKIYGRANTHWVRQLFGIMSYPTHASLFSQPFVSRGTPPGGMYDPRGIHSYSPTYVYGSNPSISMYGIKTSHILGSTFIPGPQQPRGNNPFNNIHSIRNYHMPGLPSDFGSHNVTTSPQNPFFNMPFPFLDTLDLPDIS